MPNSKMEIKLNNGFITFLNNIEINVNKAILNFQMDEEDQPREISLITEFIPKEAKVFSQVFPAIQEGIDSNIFTYEFVMNKEAIENYKIHLDNKNNLAQNSLGGGCLELQNYNYYGLSDISI